MGDDGKRWTDYFSFDCLALLLRILVLVFSVSIIGLTAQHGHTYVPRVDHVHNDPSFRSSYRSYPPAVQRSHYREQRYSSFSYYDWQSTSTKKCIFNQDDHVCIFAITVSSFSLLAAIVFGVKDGIKLMRSSKKGRHAFAFLRCALLSVDMLVCIAMAVFFGLEGTAMRDAWDEVNINGSLHLRNSWQQPALKEWARRTLQGHHGYAENIMRLNLASTIVWTVLVLVNFARILRQYRAEKTASYLESVRYSQLPTDDY